VGIELPSFRLEAGELLQHVSRVMYRGTPLHFGCTGANRYDAPTRDYVFASDFGQAELLALLQHLHGERTADRRKAFDEVIQGVAVLEIVE
jgi:hypothetical protein